MKRKKRRTLTGHELDGHEGQVMTMHAMRVSALKIAQYLDVPPHIIRRLIKSNGVIMKNGPASILEPNRDEIVSIRSVRLARSPPQVARTRLGWRIRPAVQPSAGVQSSAGLSERRATLGGTMVFSCYEPVIIGDARDG